MVKRAASEQKGYERAKRTKYDPASISDSLGDLGDIRKILACLDNGVLTQDGEALIKSLLSPSQIRQLNLNLTSGKSHVILSTLKVFNAMSAYAGGAYQRSVMDGFSWGEKSLHKLLFSRRKGKGPHVVDAMSNPDIRTLFILFILSFLSNSTPTSVKLSLLEQHRDIFLLIFKGISQDPYPVARRILEVCWEGLWNDPKIKRTLKIRLFSEQTINHLLKLYARDSPEDDIPNHIPADLVHHFMLSLTTRPGVGICFRDHGWYPRECATDDEAINPADVEVDDVGFSETQGAKINNKILSNILKLLKVNEDARQQELTFKILKACPELVAGYWGAVNLTLEPRLSSRWITNIAILGTIISFPIPSSSFLLPHSTQFNPSPPPLSSTFANVLPSVLTKSHLTRGLQSPSNLVQHCTALALCKCLIKLHRVLAAFREAAKELEEREDTGQWFKRWRELGAEAERRVPDSMVIIAMVQKYQGASNKQDKEKVKLLTESALRLLWLYHKMFPRLMAEIRFDVGKLLLSVVEQTSDIPSEDNPIETTDNMLSIPHDQGGLDILRQLHVLRLLGESEQFSWSNKSGTSSHSYLHVVLKLYMKTPSPAVRAVTSDLLSRLLSSSILFFHDPTELILWLDALPLTCRKPQATALDGTVLSDESDAVLNFLDDCVQRCTKTPYRYHEENISFFSDTTGEHSDSEDAPPTLDHANNAPSPLLMTLLEQLRAKLNANSISPSDTLAIVTFMRKLIFSLTRKWYDLQPARKLQKILEEICLLRNVSPNVPIIQDAIKRECQLLSSVLDFIEVPIIQVPVSSVPAVRQFLKQMEDLPTPSSVNAGFISASEWIDWIRLIRPMLHPDDVKRLVLAVLQFSPLLVKELLCQLVPQQSHLWHSIKDYTEELKPLLPFELTYLHTPPAELAVTTVKEFLVSLFFEGGGSQSANHKLSIVMQRLAARLKRNEMTPSHPEISLLTYILSLSHIRCTEGYMDTLKRIVFVESKPIRELCCSPYVSNPVSEEIHALVSTGLDPKSTSDKMLTLDYCTYWIAYSKRVNLLRSCTLSSPWIRFMGYTDVIQYLDVVISAAQGGHDLSDDKYAANCILETLTRFQMTPALSRDLQRRFHGLLDLRPHLGKSSALDTLLLLVAESGLPLGYNTLPLAKAPTVTVSDMSLAAQERWKNRAARLSHCSVHIAEFLRFDDWTDTSARIVSGILYQSLAARRKFSAWLAQKEPYDGSALGVIIIALHAYLDATSFQDVASSLIHIPDPWFLALVRHLLRGQDSPQALVLFASCIRIVVETSFSRRLDYSNRLFNELRNTNLTMNVPLALLIRDLHKLDAANFSTLLGEYSDQTLKWIVYTISDGVQEDNLLTVADVVSRQEAKAHLVEPLVKVAIQTCFHAPKIIQSVVSLVGSTPLKPAIVNRILQSIVQHSQLYRFTEASLSTRGPIIELLHKLFYLHPTNTCQPSHVVPLARLYGGTLSRSDRLLLSIFYLYEKQRKESAASIFHHLSFSSSGSSSQDVLGAIASLDSSQVFRTCTGFPTRRRLDVTAIKETSTIEAEGGYDPIFLTLLVVQLLAARKQLSTPEWVQVFRSNVVSVVMCDLTSRDEYLREVGVTTLAGVLCRIQNADFIEKDQVIYIINMLQDLLPPALSNPSAAPPRLSTFPVMVLAHALRSTFYPSSFLYPIISQFLLQRPEFDTTDVPMLYSLLYSSSDGGQWIRERTWMIRFLADSVREGGAHEWGALKRRHTWDLVASIWQVTRKDENSLRRGILEFLANLSVNSHAISSLVLRSGLLSWLELQLQSGTALEGEEIAFVKILENILVTADIEKSNKVMGGEFSATAARCLYAILCGMKLSDHTSSLLILSLISRIILRVASRTSPNTPVLSKVLESAMNVLRKIEPSITWESSSHLQFTLKSTLMPKPPHYAQGLFDLSLTGDRMETWGECVRLLWRATMTLGEGQGDQECWDALSCRMLLIRTSSIYYEGGSEDDIVEWTRRQTVWQVLKSEGNE